jgi:2-polyprenyl-6-methoxyphenol hydroxylase-like FAD-dependent oxidoreductase
MAQRSERILIAGAGIGGLTAGCALVRAGFEVHVIERAPELRPVGAGITVQANAMQALRRVGLDAAVLDQGLALGRSQILRADGQVLASTSLTALERTLGAPSIAIHRARLQAVLLEALGAGRVELGATVEGFDASDAGVSLRLADGRRLEGAALVGADGLRSVVRAQLHGDVEPVYAGYTTWRGIAKDPGLEPGHAGEMWGRGQRFGFVGVGFGEVYWFAVEDAPPGGRDVPGRVRSDLLERFAGFGGPARALLEGTDEAAIVRTDIADRPPLGRWGKGRVSLLGDAAHPMTPNLGQGGGQAIEDAIVLADALAGARDVEAALRAYEDRRAERARWFVLQSRSVGRVAQARGRVRGWLRDTAIQLAPRRVLERQIVSAQRFPY